MTCRLPNITQRHAGIEGGGDEGVAQRVGPDPLGDPSPSSDTAHDAASCVTVESLPGCVNEARPVDAFADGQVDRAGDPWGERHGDELAALADNGEGAMAALEAEGVDVGADRLRDPQPVQGPRVRRARGRVATRRRP